CPTIPRREPMKKPKPIAVPAFTFIVAGAGLMFSACLDRTDSSAGNNTPDDVTQVISEARNTCGNGRCDHRETCSSCPQDCGTCGGTGGSAGTTGGAGTPGGAATTAAAG